MTAHGFAAHELNRIRRIVEANHDAFLEAFGLSTSTSLYLASEITGYEVTDDHLRLNSADGGHYTIPLGMLGYFPPCRMRQTQMRNC